LFFSLLYKNEKSKLRFIYKETEFLFPVSKIFGQAGRKILKRVLATLEEKEETF